MTPAWMLLAGLAVLVPARWNSGDPKSLELLDGGVVNCNPATRIIPPRM